MEKYFKNFLDNGFDDYLTIYKVTPSELTAIGIKDPCARNLIKSHLNTYFGKLLTSNSDTEMSDDISSYENISDFFKQINLQQYVECVKAHFKNLDDFIQNLNLEDLEEIGVKKLGHQKKLLLHAKRIKGQISFTKTNLAKSLENLKNLSENSNYASGFVKPVPPKRIESTNYESFSYATLPRKRFNQNLNLADGHGNEANGNATILMQQLEPTPPAMPLISISPLGKNTNKPNSNQMESSLKVLSNGLFMSNKKELGTTTNSLIKKSLNNTTTAKPSLHVNKNVLNDIDSMLCDLNRQLDEMLDLEKVVFRV